MDMHEVMTAIMSFILIGCTCAIRYMVREQRKGLCEQAKMLNKIEDLSNACEKRMIAVEIHSEHMRQELEIMRARMVFPFTVNTQATVVTPRKRGRPPKQIGHK